MWPFAHLAVGYLLYSIYSRARFRRPPGEFAAVLVALGTQLPDLIDKPLSLIGVLASGRSLGHSYLVAIPLVLLLVGVVYRTRGEFCPVVAFGVGYLSAPLFDGAPVFLHGTLATDLREVAFWAWPLEVPAEEVVEFLEITPGVAYTIAHKAAWTTAHVPPYPELRTWIRSFEIGVTLVAVALWLVDGYPGCGLVCRVVRDAGATREFAASGGDDEQR